ncbi:hypothetical protein RB195_025690 [Necator americanus]|uniref:Uncharacterized protein n=1 Tax=Necator americanus TaxID=51031 RepID=A0ABR1EVI5_NECAM
MDGYSFDARSIEIVQGKERKCVKGEGMAGSKRNGTHCSCVGGCARSDKKAVGIEAGPSRTAAKNGASKGSHSTAPDSIQTAKLHRIASSAARSGSGFGHTQQQCASCSIDPTIM